MNCLGRAHDLAGGVTAVESAASATPSGTTAAMRLPRLVM